MTKIVDTRRRQNNGQRNIPWYEATIWHGATIFSWLRVLNKNGWRVSPAKIPLAITITLACVGNSVLRSIQTLVFSRKIRQTQLVDDPVFVVGFWRSGTTLLHELLSVDPKNSYPDTYQALSPNHFLLTGWLAKRYLKFLVPEKRPMDNMNFGWERPQEDEFALCNRGVPSSFWSVAFPGEAPQYQEYNELDISDTAIRNWKESLLTFLKLVTLQRPGRLVLKSPQHSFRVGILHELFPRSVYIRMLRSPVDVFFSTRHYWSTNYREQGLQDFCEEQLDEQILDSYLRMNSALDQKFSQLPKNLTYTIRYEELVSDPLVVLRKLYAHFGWSHFDEASEAIESYLQSVVGYQVNEYHRDAKTIALVEERLGSLIKQHGYVGQGGTRQ